MLVEYEIPQTVKDWFAIVIFLFLNDVRMVSDDCIRSGANERVRTFSLDKGREGLIFYSPMKNNDYVGIFLK